MRKHLVVALTTALVLVFGGLGYTHAAQDAGAAGPTGPPAVTGGAGEPAGPAHEFAGSSHHRHSLKAIMKKLGITDEQKKQFRSLYVGFSDRTRKARTELMALKDEKKTMLLSGKIDQQKLAQIDDQLVKTKTDLLKEKLKFKRDRLALLTPEQLDKVADWMAEGSFRSKFKKMHGGGIMHGGGGMHGGMMREGGPMMHGGGGMSD
jgi:periplasmic protein CpxP/Spy